MDSQKITFRNISDINRYLHVAESMDFDIDLQHFSCVIDGKSMLGILGFGLGQELEMKLHTEDERKIREFLARIGFCIQHENRENTMTGTVK